MGRKLGIIAALCCAFMLCFALVGCGGVDKTKYTGDWKLAYGSDENLDADSIDLMESLGLKAILTLNEDGSGTIELFGDTRNVKWEASSNTEGKITVDGSEGKDPREASLKLENEKLSIVEESGASMTFERTS